MTKIQIGANCSISFGNFTAIKVRQFGCDGTALVFGTVHTIVVDSTGLIDGTGTIYHSFSRTSDASKATITPSVRQVDIDRQDYDGVYDPAFDGIMQTIFGDYGTLAVIAMGIPFILGRVHTNNVKIRRSWRS